LSATPSRPAPGAFIRLTLSDSSRDSVAIRGSMAGEPLHFRQTGRGRWQAMAGIPIDASRSLTARVYVERAGRTDTVTTRVIVPELRVASSNLSVATRFSDPMDSAIAARVARENARARGVGQHAHETPQLWRAPFLKPRASVVTSQFGTGRVFNGAVTSRHLGVDFRGEIGAEVRAANRGVVALVDTFFLAGRLVPRPRRGRGDRVFPSERGARGGRRHRGAGTADRARGRDGPRDRAAPPLGGPLRRPVGESPGSGDAHRPSA